MSQRDIILAKLQEAAARPNEADRWVSLAVLAQAAQCYAVSERISELRRKQGYNIENKIEVQPGGQKWSWYRLVGETEKESG